MRLLVGLITIAWLFGWLALSIYGFKALLKDYGALGALLGILTVTLYPCVYGLDTILSSRFPGPSSFARFVVIVCIFVSFFGGFFLMLASCRARGLCG